MQTPRVADNWARLWSHSKYDQMLNDRGVIIAPDTLANARGVVVS
jgi:glutamate dehydrogenase/leucine dehydrogenase